MRAYSIAVAFSLLLMVLLGLQLLASPIKASMIEANVDIVPDVFNLKRMESEGGFITAYVSNLTYGSVSYDVHEVNVTTIGLYYGISLVAEALRVKVEDDTLVVKFDSTTVANYIWTSIVYHMGTVPPQANMTITLTVSGKLNNEEQFAGSDTVKIMVP